MYQNCAYLQVVGTPSSFTGPKMFVANTGQPTTTEGVEIAFPNPGNGVEYGGDYAGGTNVPSTSDCANIAGNRSPITTSLLPYFRPLQRCAVGLDHVFSCPLG